MAAAIIRSIRQEGLEVDASRRHTGDSKNDVLLSFFNHGYLSFNQVSFFQSWLPKTYLFLSGRNKTNPKGRRHFMTSKVDAQGRPLATVVFNLMSLPFWRYYQGFSASSTSDSGEDEKRRDY